LYPELIHNRFYLEMSESSMATALVSGSMALMLEANPHLNPNLVKLILMSAAVKLDLPSVLEQGNGMVNLKTAVDLAAAIDRTARTVAKTSPTWELPGGEEVWAGGAFAYGDQVICSALVDSSVAESWGNGIFWSDAIVRANQGIWADGVFWSDALLGTDSPKTDVFTGDPD
jgi:hypothetical protein